MKSSEKLCRGLLAALLLLLFGCAHHQGAPNGWLPTARVSPPDMYGGWIEIEMVTPYANSAPAPPLSNYEGMPGTPTPAWEYQPTFQGELIAVDADSVHVLADWGLMSLPWTSVRRARLSGYDPQTAALAGWAAGGIVTSIPQGYFFLLSLPTWALFGGFSTGLQAHQGRIEYPKSRPEMMAIYARFPQGMPPGLDRAHLVWKITRSLPPPRGGLPGS